MEETTGQTCPQCGATGPAQDCPACGRRRAAAPLRLLAGGAGARMADAPPDVRLVREYKGPTARDLASAPAEVIDLLPGRVLSVEAALRADDLREADRRMDCALGLVLRGPGHASRRSGLLIAVLLVAWCAGLLSTLAWALG